MRTLFGLLASVAVASVVFLAALQLGALIISEAVQVGYALTPDHTEAVYRLGTTAMILNLVHALVWGCLLGGKTYRGIAGRK